MTTFDWMSSPGNPQRQNYIYHEDTKELSRAIGIAGVYPARDHYRVHLSYRFDDLVPPTAYILKHKFPTLGAAKRAVERKVPPLIAVLKIQGVQI